MPWFRVDDDFALHPKAVAAGNTALGLWVRAGAYAAQYLTEGFVPQAAVATLGGRPRDAKALVDVGLWVVVPGGYRFHQWDDRQPSKAQVEADRRAAAERQRRARERARQNRGSQPGSQEQSHRDAPEGVTRDSRSPRPGPAQTPSLLTFVSRLAGSDARVDEPLPAGLVESWEEIAGPLVNLEHEARAYLAHHADRPARDERAAWLGWLRKARELAERRAAAAPRPLGCDQCDAGWMPPTEDDERPRPCPTCRPHLRAV